MPQTSINEVAEVFQSSASTCTPPNRLKLIVLAIARSLTLLALGLWIGGLAFFGALAAPAMFKVARAANQAQLAPQMVALMLSRFGFVMMVCCVLLLFGWLVEKWSGALRDRAGQIWWWVQGAATLVFIAVVGVLNGVLMPRILALQSRQLADDASVKIAFDAAHQGYSRCAAFGLYAALLILIALAWRTARDSQALR